MSILDCQFSYFLVLMKLNHQFMESAPATGCPFIQPQHQRLFNTIQAMCSPTTSVTVNSEHLILLSKLIEQLLGQSPSLQDATIALTSQVVRRRAGPPVSTALVPASTSSQSSSSTSSASSSVSSAQSKGVAELDRNLWRVNNCMSQVTGAKRSRTSVNSIADANNCQFVYSS